MMRMVLAGILLFSFGVCVFGESAGLITVEQSKLNRKQYVEEDYKLLKEEDNKEAEAELDRLVGILNGLTFQAKIVEKVVEVIEVNEPNVVDVAEVDEPNMAEIIAELDNSMKFNPDPNEVISPIKLADTLYKSGRGSIAIAYYKKALGDCGQGEEELLKKCWALYQIGNCLRDERPGESVDYYDRLLAEYPGSKWADFALVQKQIVELMASEKDKLENIKNKTDDEKAGNEMVEVASLDKVK